MRTMLIKKPINPILSDQSIMGNHFETPSCVGEHVKPWIPTSIHIFGNRYDNWQK